MRRDVTRLFPFFSLVTILIFFICYTSLSDNKFSREALDKTTHINLEGQDVIVDFHIQKTGGTVFSQHLVGNLDVDSPCQCNAVLRQCTCQTKNKRVWLFSSHSGSVGKVCGVHADWTELSDCLEDWFKDNDVESRKKRRYV